MAEARFEIPSWRCERALERLTHAHLLDSVAPGRDRMHGLLRLVSSELTETELDLQATANGSRAS
jgi:hypothetical protein